MPDALFTGRRTPDFVSSGSDRLLVVTHVPHYRHSGRVYAYGPYVREINIWCELFSTVTIAAPVRSTEPKGDCLPLGDLRIRLEPQPETGGPTVGQKIRQLLLFPYLLIRIARAARSADVIHVRCPGTLGLAGVLISPMCVRRRIAKYAGQWGPFDGETLSVRVQRVLLRSRWWNAPVLVYTDGQSDPPYVIPFFTAGLSETQIAIARKVAANRNSTRLGHILYAGRLSRSKNVDTLLEAFATVAAEGSPLTCTIVGEGPERESLERLAVSLGIEDRVYFLGGLPQNEVLSYYEKADILVLVSETEGWSKTLTEGMAFGLICIGTNKGLTRWMLSENRGLLVPPGDPRALADAFRYIAQMPIEQVRELRSQAASWGQRFTIEQFEESLRVLLRTAWSGVPDHKSLMQSRANA